MTSAEIEHLLNYHQRNIRVLSLLEQLQFDFAESKRSIVTTEWNPILCNWYKDRAKILKHQIKRLISIYYAIKTH